MAQRVTFTDDGARRIVSAVRGYERGNRDQPPVKFRAAGDDDGLRLGRISATWNKGAVAEVEQVDKDGSPLDPSVTFEAKNWFAEVTVTSGHKMVACGYAGGRWILIAAECG
jgi:hypothetical protein